jgi:hypothetical protein
MRLRQVLALSLLLGVGLLNSLRTLQQSIRQNSNLLASTHVAPLDQALRPVLPSLPDTVGFLGDPRLTNSMYARAGLATLYCVAPRIVHTIGAARPSPFVDVPMDAPPANPTIPDVVIAYSQDVATFDPVIAELDLVVIRQLDPYTLLLCRRAVVDSPACPFARF